MSEAKNAVFLSYASQDAVAAGRICAELRAAGIEVWFDQSELRGGDVWDQKIRREIRECALFIPIVSANTQARLEGYFRREWKLAVGRTHDMADEKPFLVPVVIDGTSDQDASVPELFRAVQWTRLPGGATPELFVERVARLLSPADAAGHASNGATLPSRLNRAKESRRGTRGRKIAWFAAVTIVIVGVGIMRANKLSESKLQSRAIAPAVIQSAPLSPTTGAFASPGFAPPAHSVAVLPFVNMSGDPKQDYFSDGLAEELLNSLSSIPDLHVAARTSSFYFKGDKLDLAEIARKLNVGAILEGSVRKDGSHVRITAELVNAQTGFQLWSHAFDRDLKDVLKLQAEIATDVSHAMQVTLLTDATAAIELGGTHNPAAFDAFLRGRAHAGPGSRERSLSAIADFDEAIRLDPQFARAYATKAMSETGFAEYYGTQSDARLHFERGRDAARRAIALTPALGVEHAALAMNMQAGFLDLRGALAEFDSAIQLSPNDSMVLLQVGWFYANLGRGSEGVALAQHGVSLDQLNAKAYRLLAVVLLTARQYPQVIETTNRALSLDPHDVRQTALRGQAQLFLDDLEAARQSCDTPPLDWESRTCLAIVLNKLHRQPEAEAQRTAMVADLGDSSAYQFAEIYAQWGDVPNALQWLDKAYRLRDPGLSGIKTDQAMDPLRQEPRFKEILNSLDFPS